MDSFKMSGQYWAGDDVISKQGGEMSQLVEAPPSNEIYLCADGTIFREYICDALGASWDSYTCRIG